jgi:hypothetical protein
MKDLGALIRLGFELDEMGPDATPAQCRDFLTRLDRAAYEVGPEIFDAVYQAEKAAWAARGAEDG